MTFCDDEAIREICDFEDTRDPLFEFETDAHEEWVRNAKANCDETGQ
jgi:hypothetical protein